MSGESRILAGRYRLEEVIGRGGMALVYRGLDLKLDREVAVKVLNAALAADEGFRTRFRLEAQAASRMSHPSIVRVYDAGEDADPDTGAPVPFIVMELVHGTMLRTVMDRGPVPLADALRYVDGILEALDYSHRAGVVHRDIKPGNVMITEDGAVKVTDFGIARAVSDSSSTVAETTRIIGTAAYFSPEQAKGEAVDARADLYSAGVVLYELLAGRQPFRGETPIAVAYQHVSETPLAPTEINEEAPGAINPVVLRALAKDPFQRFQDAASFRSALAEAAAGRAPSTRVLDALTSDLYGLNPRQAEETARSLRQLGSDMTTTRTQAGPPVVWIWVSVIFVAILVASVAFWAVTSRPDGIAGQGRIIPTLTTTQYEVAAEELRALDLVPVRHDEAHAEVPAGHVIRTEPGAGLSVPAGSEVAVYVSSGVEPTQMPTVAGLSLDAATNAIERAELRLGRVERKNDPHTLEGIVLSASHEVGAELPPGTVIDLVIASGVVELKNFENWPLDAAVSEIESAGLSARPVSTDACEATTPATVVSMSLAPGDVPVGSTVELVYCAGGPAEPGDGEDPFPPGGEDTEE